MNILPKVLEDMINDYKYHMELYAHKQKFNKTLVKINSLRYKQLSQTHSKIEINNKVINYNLHPRCLLIMSQKYTSSHENGLHWVQWEPKQISRLS